MTDMQHVVQTCKAKNLDLIKPSKADKTILVIDWSAGFGKQVVDAKTWKEAREQLAKLNRDAPWNG